jgi:dTMP kinase
MFITFEGGEGTGKSTQARRLVEHLRGRGMTVVLTREPGGTEQGEAVRSLLVNGDPKRWSPISEALLNNAARDAHLRDVIRPALARGDIVISDRFMDSTRAYQGFAGQCPMEFIDELERQVVAQTKPQLTLVFDLDPAIGLARAKTRGAGIEDRYERKGMAFHLALREGFRAIVKADRKRCNLIDASGSEHEVYNAVLKAFEAARHG